MTSRQHRTGDRANGSAIADAVEIAFEGKTHRILIRRSLRARRLTLRVRAASRDVVLTMPARGSAKGAKHFVERHAAWIGDRLARVPEAVHFVPGAVIPLRGLSHVIDHVPGRRGLIEVEAGRTEGESSRIRVGGDVAFVARRVRDYLVQQARLDLATAVHRHATELGLAPKRISVRDTTTRWGSCSSSGSLSFSWRLILAPSSVLDYLAAHEVAHLAHMNHSPAFWRVVASLEPQYHAAEAWLKANGSALMRYGARDGESLTQPAPLF